ncbi:hypothetical protein ANCCAN_02433 [Ancylostoma caninum]|uniref:Tyr recombinase domain-containing protein n=1 Tax=Ancylostoma caninum TaxID=29170 RepID=A0A368H4D9_ANCCA|nr:hypothetical protein ANCCAN_02433 [Ancylostoma caninum]
MILIAFVAMLSQRIMCSSSICPYLQREGLVVTAYKEIENGSKKSGRNGSIPHPASLWEQYRGMVDQGNPEQFLFETLGGDRFKTDNAARFIKKTLEGAGLGHKGLTSHSFRGEAATTAIRGGATLLNVMRAGRWKSVKALECYIDPTPL